MANLLDILKSKTTSEVVTAPINHLTTSEIEFLLILIKNSSFKGEQLELVYTTAVKLQSQYLQLTSTK
jgi:hypothetical protein